MMVIGLGLSGLAVVGGGGVWLIYSRGLFSSVASNQSPALLSSLRSTPTSLGTLFIAYRGHSDAVHAVAWSPDSRRIASGSYDRTVQVWDAVTGSNTFTYRGHSSDVDTVAWSPDGRRIASGSGDETVQVWDAADGGNIYTHPGNLVNVTAGTFPLGPLGLDSGSVLAVDWSPNGRSIASGSGGGTVQVWDAADGRNVYTYRGHLDYVTAGTFPFGLNSGSVLAVDWSPDGTRIASGSADKTVQVWDAANGGHVFTYHGHTGYVYAVAWSPDGKRIASGSLDGTVQVWDVANGDNTFIYRGHTNSVYTVAWSPDGTRIASGSNDNTVQVWAVANGGNTFIYRGHTNSVYAVAWSPNGTRIASGSKDNTVQVWGVG